MIRVVAKQTIKADKLEEYLPVMRSLVEKTNANDPGCISYEAYQDVNDPTVITMIEQWESQEAVDAHLKSAHFLEIAPILDSMCAVLAEVTFYKKLF